MLLSTQDGSLTVPEGGGAAAKARVGGDASLGSDDEDVLEGDGYR